MLGKRLKQARLLKRMTQRELAERICDRDYKVNSATVSRYEQGRVSPPDQFLLHAGTVLGVHTPYFSHQPGSRVEWQSFRRHSTLGKKDREAVEGYATDLADLQLRLFALLKVPKSPEFPAPVHVTSNTRTERAANKLRNCWKMGDAPAENLVATAEDKGVIVIKWNRSEDFDGLSGRCGGYPVVVINTGKSADRTRFSLAHELGHLAMDTSAVSPKEEERLANRFAAAFLAPEQAAIRELRSVVGDLDWDVLAQLKQKYGLSMSAWARRAYDLNFIDKSEFVFMNRDLRIRGWYRDEPVEYLGYEEPAQLRAMARDSLLQGLIEPDLVSQVGLDNADADEEESEGVYPRASELLGMDECKRQQWMDKMFEWAQDLDVEVFEAFGEEEF